MPNSQYARQATRQAADTSARGVSFFLQLLLGFPSHWFEVVWGGCALGWGLILYTQPWLLSLYPGLYEGVLYPVGGVEITAVHLGATWCTFGLLQLALSAGTHYYTGRALKPMLWVRNAVNIFATVCWVALGNAFRLTGAPTGFFMYAVFMGGVNFGIWLRMRLLAFGLSRGWIPPTYRRFVHIVGAAC